LSDDDGQHRRAHDRLPIRLEVVYRSARSLVTEYTTSVSKGGCRLQSKQPLAVGTRFEFQMLSGPGAKPVEILGEVVWCQPGPEKGLHEVGIRYLPADDKRAALEAVLEEIFKEHAFDKKRVHVRVPVNLVAEDAAQPTRKYLVRDISTGGIGLRLPVDLDLSDELKTGTRVTLAVTLGKDTVEIRGEVVWTLARRPGLTHAALGVTFRDLGPEHLRTIEALCHLSRPAVLRLSLGR
jgi:uncharacterized protein (TIGR02266 family)